MRCVRHESSAHSSSEYSRHERKRWLEDTRTLPQEEY